MGRIITKQWDETMNNIEDVQKKLSVCERDVNDLFQRAITLDFLNDASMLRERLDILLSNLRSLSEREPKTAAIVEAEEVAKALIHRLDSLTTPNVICRDNAKVLFQEAGQWARHFSTVRMTVATFTITSCTAIVALASKKDGLASPSEVIDPVVILWILGLSVFWIFTVATYRQLYHQRKGFPVFLGRPLQGSVNYLPFDWASLVIATLCLTVSIFAYLQKDLNSCFAKTALPLTTAFGIFFLTIYRRLARRS